MVAADSCIEYPHPCPWQEEFIILILQRLVVWLAKALQIGVIRELRAVLIKGTWGLWSVLEFDC